MDFVPLLTQHIVDDVASHLRLYRKAKVYNLPFITEGSLEKKLDFFKDFSVLVVTCLVFCFKGTISNIWQIQSLTGRIGDDIF